MRSATRSLLMVIGCAVACVAMGAASATAGRRDDWYDRLAKPAWTPPGAVFGIVWTVLYAMMGAAAALVLLPDGKRGGRASALGAFAIQLGLNLAWSPVFFRLHSPGGALTVIVALWLAIGWTVARFWSVRDLAGLLLMPYWAWVTFAVALNAAIWRLNG